MKTSLRDLLPWSIVFLASCLAGQQATVDLVDTEVYPRIKVYGTFLGANGEPVCNLGREHFRLFELGEEQRLRVLSGKATDTSLALLLDESGSMADVVSQVRAAGKRFVGLLGGSDRATTYAFSGGVRVLRPMLDVSAGRNRQALIDSLDRYYNGGGGTELYRAIDQLISVELAKEKERRRAIVALTDGVSGGSIEAAIAAAQKNRVAIYTIGMGGADPSALDTLARATGGRYYQLSAEPSADELAGVYKDIRQRLECQYTLIYDTPNVCPDGAELSFRVTVPSLDAEVESSYQRPLNFEQLDLNLRFVPERKIGLEPPRPIECETVELSGWIEATSCSDELVLKGVVIRAYDTERGTGEQRGAADRREVAKSEPVAVQSNGDPVEVIVPWESAGFRGRREIELVIDPVDQILEGNEEDNLRSIQVELQALIHDLYVKAIEATPKPAAPCERVELAVTVDDGSQCKGMVLDNIEVEARDGDRVLGRAVVTLVVGKPEPLHFAWDPAGFVGHRPLTIVVDPERKFGVEQTRDNNTKQALIEVAPVLHDLKPVSVTLAPREPAVGDEVTLTVEIENTGRCPGLAVPNPVRLRIALAGGGRHLADSEPFSLSTGERILVPVTFTSRLSDEGEQRITLTVDPDLAVRESDEENNAREESISFAPMPHDLVFGEIELKPALLVDGDPASLTVVVTDDARFAGVPLDGVALKVYDRYQGFLIGESQSGRLISQGSTTFEIDLDTGGLAGQRELKIVIDPDRRIPEERPDGTDGENNNEKVLAVEVAER